jgi:hypothetical protein
MATTIEIGAIAEYTCDEHQGDKAGQTRTGDVVKVGKTYADVMWRHNGRTERLHFRDKREMAGITFTAETAEQADAARHDLFYAALPLLYRRTEQQRIEAEHDERPGLVHQGRRTSAWCRAVAATMRARTVEIDRMVAALRPGDQVRQVDDETGTVWTIREIWEGNDGWFWLSLRRMVDGTEVWNVSGCRARAVDLVAAATDDQHAAELEAKLHDEHRTGWITADQYTAGLQRIADEVYAFAGDGPDTPPYWVIRRGRAVTYIRGREVNAIVCADVATARARFADESCDPDGPRAPQPRDTITISYGDHAGEHLVVSTATRPDDGHFAIEAVRPDGAEVALTVADFQYDIVHRPQNRT